MMENNDGELASYEIIAIPGQNGKSPSVDYIRSIIKDPKMYVGTIGTLFRNVDLGQINCVNHIKESLPAVSNFSGLDKVIWASSQGVASILNYIKTYGQGNIKCLILESSMVSANSAIYRISHYENVPIFKYFVPYLIRFYRKGIFKTYSPTGMQAINSIDELDKDTVVIILHSMNDPQIPDSDSKALYYKMVSMGMTNVYLYILKGGEHNDILKTEYEKCMVISILCRHGILTPSNYDNNIPELQTNAWKPPISMFKDDYEKLMKRERRIRLVCPILITFIIILIIWIILSIKF